MDSDSQNAERWFERVERISRMQDDEIAAAIEASHPVENKEAGVMDADALAMQLIRNRYEKRDLVNLVRWLLIGAPSKEKSPQWSKPTLPAAADACRTARSSEGSVPCSEWLGELEAELSAAASCSEIPRRPWLLSKQHSMTFVLSRDNEIIMGDTACKYLGDDVLRHIIAAVNAYSPTAGTER